MRRLGVGADRRDHSQQTLGLSRLGSRLLRLRPSGNDRGGGRVALDFAQGIDDWRCGEHPRRVVFCVQVIARRAGALRRCRAGRSGGLRLGGPVCQTVLGLDNGNQSQRHHGGQRRYSDEKTLHGTIPQAKKVDLPSSRSRRQPSSATHPRSMRLTGAISGRSSARWSDAATDNRRGKYQNRADGGRPLWPATYPPRDPAAHDLEARARHGEQADGEGWAIALPVPRGRSAHSHSR